MAVNAFKHGTQAPEGFELPAAAVGLMDAAAAAGWVTGWQWDQDNGGAHFVSVHVGHEGTGEQFRYVWHSRFTGSLRLFSKTHSPGHGRAWEDGPSLKQAVSKILA